MLGFIGLTLTKIRTLIALRRLTDSQSAYDALSDGAYISLHFLSSSVSMTHVAQSMYLRQPNLRWSTSIWGK